MNSTKEKDRILAQIIEHKRLNEIEDAEQHLSELERDGLISIRRDEQRNPIFVRITDLGKSFVEKGGYAKAHSRTMRKKLGESAIRVAEGIAIALVSGYIGWLLKGFTQSESTAPSQAEPTEQYSTREDSVTLSSEASSFLKQESVDSRAKSFTTISDSSAKTRLADSICNPSMQTSTLHRDNSPSSPAVGYKPTPSGK